MNLYSFEQNDWRLRMGVSLLRHVEAAQPALKFCEVIGAKEDPAAIPLIAYQESARTRGNTQPVRKGGGVRNGGLSRSSHQVLDGASVEPQVRLRMGKEQVAL